MSITLRELNDLRSAAVGIYNEFPIRPRLEGTSRDLVEDEVRVLAIYEASLRLLSSKGAISRADEYGAIFQK